MNLRPPRVIQGFFGYTEADLRYGDFLAEEEIQILKNTAGEGEIIVIEPFGQVFAESLVRSYVETKS